MVRTEPAEGVTLESHEAFPAVEVEKEWNTGLNTEVEVDPISSQVAEDVESKERAKAVEQKRDKERCDAMRNLKSTIMISAAFVSQEQHLPHYKEAKGEIRSSSS